MFLSVFEAHGQEAAAHAINDAKRTAAEKNRDGSVGEAKALQDQRIRVAAVDGRADDDDTKKEK